MNVYILWLYVHGNLRPTTKSPVKRLKAAVIVHSFQISVTFVAVLPSHRYCDEAEGVFGWDLKFDLMPVSDQ